MRWRSTQTTGNGESHNVNGENTRHWTVLVIGSLVALITWLGGERKGAGLFTQNPSQKKQ